MTRRSRDSYSEDSLVEQPAIALLSSLGWATYQAYDEFNTAGGSPLGRETKSDVILLSRLRPALLKLNPDASPEAIDQAIEELTRDRSRMSLVAANREIYELMKNGIRIHLEGREDEEERVELIRVIDWDDAKNNDSLLCSQFWVTGEMYTPSLYPSQQVIQEDEEK